MRKLLRAVSAFSSLTLGSRILGFVRDILMARYLGAGLAADAFFIAFKLPNFFRRLFAEGAFAAAFVPIFTAELGEGEDRRPALRFAEEALACLLAALLLLTALVQVAMPWLMLGLAPGFADDPAKFDLAVWLTRLTFPYLLFISLVALFSGMLNSVGRFSEAAAAPILLNLVLIASLSLFHGTALATAEALAIAVSIAGIVQLVWVGSAAVRQGLGLGLRWPRLTPQVKRLLIIMAPIAVGAGAAQLNLLIDIMLASLLPEGSLSFLFFADRLNQLPVGVIGVAIGTVVLPSLSRDLAAGRDTEAAASLNRALELALFLTIPAAAALMSVPQTLIAGLFQQGAFDAADAHATAAALRAYAIGLPAYILVKVLAPAFFARQDSKTPVRVSIAALILNTILNIILMQYLAHVGLALATAIAAWVNGLSLAIILMRRGHWRPDARLISRTLRILLATGLMAAALGGLERHLPTIGGAAVETRIAILLALVSGGLAAYGLSAVATRAIAPGELKRLAERG